MQSRLMFDPAPTSVFQHRLGNLQKQPLFGWLIGEAYAEIHNYRIWRRSRI